MRTIHRYLTGQIVSTLLLTVAVFTFVLILGNVLKEILTLLINGQASAWLVLQALGLLLPYVLVYALPIGLLTAVLLVFGRFSADQELTALRANGVSLVQIVLPVLVLSLLLSGLCAAINLHYGPACRAAYKNLIKNVDLTTTADLFIENTFIEEIPGYWIYLGRKEGDRLQNVRIFTLNPEGEIDGDFSARSGRLDINEQTGHIQIQLRDATVMNRFSTGDGSEDVQWSAPGYLAEWYSHPIQIRSRAAGARKPKINHMTLEQLQSELSALRHAASVSARSGIPAASGPTTPGDDPVDISLPVVVQIHHQISFSFACFSFALIGIPLGIQTHRRETTIGVAYSLLLLSVYYAFLITAKSLDVHPEWHPELIVWLPNFLFQGVGCYLLWKTSQKA